MSFCFSVEFLSFLVDFCTPQKSLKNRIPQNTSQKLSKSTCFAPLAAQNRFLMIRVSILASFWHPFFIKKSYFFENRQKHKNLIKPMKNQWFWAPKPPIFASIFDQNFMLVPNAFQNLFFPPFGRQSAPTSRRIEFVGSLLAPPRILRGPQNQQKSPKWCQNASKT